MRSALHIALALALVGIAGSIAGAYTPSGTLWVVNSSTQVFLQTKYKVSDGWQVMAPYYARPVTVQFTVTETRFMGSYAPLSPTNPTQSAFLSIPGVVGKAGEYGGKYAFSSKKADPALRSSFHSALSAFADLLDSALRDSTSVPYLGGTLEILDAKASGKAGHDPELYVAEGKYKISLAGTLLNGPRAGKSVKGRIAISFEHALPD